MPVEAAKGITQRFAIITLPCTYHMRSTSISQLVHVELDAVVATTLACAGAVAAATSSTGPAHSSAPLQLQPHPAVCCECSCACEVEELQLYECGGHGQQAAVCIVQG